MLATLAVVKTAIEQQVPKFFLISSDQAAHPTNIVGASKRLAEMVLQSLMAEAQPRFEIGSEPVAQLQRKTQFAVVRIGNLLTSTTPVIQNLRKQIDHGGPVTIADRTESHCWISIAEATRRVLMTTTVVGSREEELGQNIIFQLDRGEPVMLTDLIRRMVEWSKAGSNLLFWHIFGIGGEQGENALAVRSDRVDYTFA